MATVRPFRNYYDTTLTASAFWGMGASAEIFHNYDYILIGTDNSSPQTESYRAALKFNNPAIPSWCSLGPISTAGMALLIVLDQRMATAGGSLLEIAKITAPWDDTFSAAQMRGLPTTAFNALTAMKQKYGSLEAMWRTPPMHEDNGFMFRYNSVASARGNIRLSTKPAPIMRYYYQYAATLATRTDATERTAVSAEAEKVLNQESEGSFSLELEALKEERLPETVNVFLTPVKGTSAGVTQRVLNWPESWELGIPAAGGLSISDASDGDKLNGLKGAALRSKLMLQFPTGKTEEISRGIQLIGDIIRGNDGNSNIELCSPSDAILSTQIADYDPAGTNSVNYLSEHSIYIIADLLLNSGKWLYERLLYNDLIYLLRRFGSTFSTFTYAYTDLQEKTVGELLQQIGTMNGLCLSTTSGGCIALFHPSVYRPSIKVWTLNEGDCLPGSLTISSAGRNSQYGAVRVSDESATPWTKTYYPTNAIVTSENKTENIFEYTASGTFFANWAIAKDALGRHLVQRLCSPVKLLSFSLGPKGLQMEVGDQTRMTAHSLESETTFFITSVMSEDLSGIVQVEAINYPDLDEMHSTFEDSGLQGLWRWWDPILKTSDFVNRGYTGTDPAWVVHSGNFAYYLFTHWQGVQIAGNIGTDLILKNSALLNNTSNVCDTFDVCLSLAGNMNTTTRNWVVFADENYIPILLWKKTAGTEAIIMGIARPGYDPAGTASVLTNELFIGHTLDSTATPVVWSTVAYSPAGVAGREQAGIADSSNAPASIALQWKDSAVKLFIDRKLITNSNSGFNKTGYTELYYCAHGHLYGYGEVNIGCLRHLKTTGWIENTNRLQGLNGTDPYYP